MGWWRDLPGYVPSAERGVPPLRTQYPSPPKPELGRICSGTRNFREPSSPSYGRRTAAGERRGGPAPRPLALLVPWTPDPPDPWPPALLGAPRLLSTPGCQCFVASLVLPMSLMEPEGLH